MDCLITPFTPSFLGMKNPLDLHQALRELVVVQQPVAVAIAQLPPGGAVADSHRIHQASLVQHPCQCVSLCFFQIPLKKTQI